MSNAKPASFLITGVKEECYGCLACINICKTGALHQEKDSEGFIYPVIDNEKCVLCGKCASVCPYTKEADLIKSSPKVFYAWNNNTKTRLESSSGGVFTAIANKIICYNGVTYGAAYTENMGVSHIRTCKSEDIQRLRGSKYVQSDLSNIFNTLKSDLKANKLVYFTGTPCQISAIKKITGNPVNLITSDLVCHGVPSAQMFQEQLSLFEEKITSISFRDKKRTGWGCDLKIESLKKEWRMEPLTLPYFYGFWKNSILRPSCYNCQFSRIRREGDITLADYWLVKKSHPGIRTGKGVSAIMVNTEKGENIVSQLNDITIEKSNIENLLKGLGRLKSPVKKPKERDLIMQEYSQKGFSHIAHLYLTPSARLIIKEKSLRLFKQIILFKYWK